VVREYLAGRPDPLFDAVKYRRRVAAVVARCHLRLTDERQAFLFGERRAHPFKAPLLAAVQRARYSRRAVYELPFTIAEGFAQKHGIPRAEFLEKIRPQMTAQERARLSGSAAREGVDLAADLARRSLTQLALYCLSLDPAARAAARGRLEEGFSGACARVLRAHPARLGRTAAILDNSDSSSGSHEKRRRPLAVAFAVDQLLSRACEEYPEHVLYHGLYGAAPPLGVTARRDRVANLDDLAGALEDLRRRWAESEGLLLEGLRGAPLSVEEVRRFGPFRLQRFHTCEGGAGAGALGLSATGDGHIGEAIVRDDGALEYIKTYRLSRAQAKRAYLLQVLSEREWDLERVAGFFQQSREEVVQRLAQAGFGYLLKPGVLAAAGARGGR
jgi:hypothetical protein